MTDLELAKAAFEAEKSLQKIINLAERNSAMAVVMDFRKRFNPEYVVYLLEKQSLETPLTSSEAAIQPLVGPSAPSVPDGWQLVPKEPTRQMTAAASDCRVDGYRGAYQAMLAAAPKPESDKQ